MVRWWCGSVGEGTVRGGELHGACAAPRSPAEARPRTLCAHAAAASASAPAACWLLAQLARARAAAAAAARPSRASRAPAACPSTPSRQIRAFALHATAFASRSALQLGFPALRPSAAAASYSAFSCWRSACVSPNSLLLGAAEGHGDARVEHVAQLTEDDAVLVRSASGAPRAPSRRARGGKTDRACTRMLNESPQGTRARDVP